jgi:hypothetical protein
MAVLILPLLAAPVHAQSGTPASFGEALKNWAATHKIKHAFIAVRRDGRTVERLVIAPA